MILRVLMVKHTARKKKPVPIKGTESQALLARLGIEFEC